MASSKRCNANSARKRTWSAFACRRCAEGLGHLCEHMHETGIGFGIPGAFADRLRIPNATLGANVHQLPDELAAYRLDTYHHYETRTLRRQLNGGAWTTVRQVSYVYYDGTQAHGNAGDLMTATVKDGAGNALDTSYYRYYTMGDLENNRIELYQPL